MNMDVVDGFARDKEICIRNKDVQRGDGRLWLSLRDLEQIANARSLVQGVYDFDIACHPNLPTGWALGIINKASRIRTEDDLPVLTKGVLSRLAHNRWAEPQIARAVDRYWYVGGPRTQEADAENYLNYLKEKAPDFNWVRIECEDALNPDRGPMTVGLVRTLCLIATDPQTPNDIHAAAGRALSDMGRELHEQMITQASIPPEYDLLGRPKKHVGDGSLLDPDEINDMVNVMFATDQEGYPFLTDETRSFLIMRAVLA